MPSRRAGGYAGDRSKSTLNERAAERRPPPRVGLTMIIQLPSGPARLDVEVLGEGDPVVVIQTALHADELRPLATMLAEGGLVASSTITAVGMPGASR